MPHAIVPPLIREGATLPRLDRVNDAIASLEKNAFAVLPLLKLQSLPIMAKACESINEILLWYIEKLRQAVDLSGGHSNKAADTAAFPATQAAIPLPIIILRF